MTEESVRTVFFKNYFGGDLNEALMAAVEEVSMTIIKEGAEKPESLPEIVKTIAMAKSHVALFGGMVDGTSPVVPITYLIYFDQVRKAMVDVIRYTRDNLEVMNPWFKEQFTKENLESMSTEMALSIEEAAKRPANVRAFNSSEPKIYEEFFNMALIGIIGLERFKKYIEEYNKCAVVLRQCQSECKKLGGEVGAKES